MTDTLENTSHDIEDPNFDIESVGHTHLPTNTGVSNEKLGMWVFLGSECLMFGGLISTYLLYKNRPGISLGTVHVNLVLNSKKSTC